jgi:hypothetical protein
MLRRKKDITYTHNQISYIHVHKPPYMYTHAYVTSFERIKFHDLARDFGPQPRSKFPYGMGSLFSAEFRLHKAG